LTAVEAAAVDEDETVDADGKPRATLVLAGQRTAAVTVINQYNSIVRLHRMHEMQTIDTDVRGVSLSVCHAAQLCAVPSCSLCQVTLTVCYTPHPR